MRACLGVAARGLAHLSAGEAARGGGSENRRLVRSVSRERMQVRYERRELKHAIRNPSQSAGLTWCLVCGLVCGSHAEESGKREDVAAYSCWGNRLIRGSRRRKY